MQIYRKTRKGFSGNLIKQIVKIFVLISALIIIIFLIDNADLPKPSKIIKQEISNEQFKIVK